MSMTIENHSNTTSDKQSRKRMIGTGFLTRYVERYAVLAKGKASAVIVQVDKLKRNEKVALWVRVSGKEQERGSNLSTAESSLRKEMERRGTVVRKAFTYTGTGKELSQAFHDAIQWCLENDCVLVAESTDRFIRHYFYHSEHKWRLQATEEQLQLLKQWARGVVLATILDPDTTPEEVRAYQTKRGMIEKDRMGGKREHRTAGYKKRIREYRKPTAVQMREEGKSLGEIAKSLSLPRSTIQYWLM